MDYDFAIFDMDGTLVDSMPYWAQLTNEYLESMHLPQEDLTDLRAQVEHMSLLAAAEFFQRALGLDRTPEEVYLEMGDLMDRHYQEDIPLRSGVREVLERLRDEGVAMCVLTLTPAPLARHCLDRLGIGDYFAFIICSDDVGIGKDNPRAFAQAAWEFGAYPSECVVFEDSHYAARAAKAAGCPVVGIYEETSAANWPRMAEICDMTFHSWEEAINIL